MKRGRPQSGYALLLVVMMMSAGSAALLSPLLSYLPKPDAVEAVAERSGLLSSRQSLLVYAALYPYLYGPRSAGPGHLPCPDVDGSEGPDPPCGHGSVASGRLPRHISLPGLRYAFNAQVEESYQYTVSTNLINNPVNRVVNDELLRWQADNATFPAWMHFSNEADRAFTGSPGVPISSNAMIPGIRKLVAAWLLSRLNRNGVAACLVAEADDQAVTMSPSQRLLMQIADDVEDAASQCAVPDDWDLQLQSLQIEGVPASTHWFVRNRWQEGIALSNSELPLTMRDIRFP